MSYIYGDLFTYSFPNVNTILLIAIDKRHKEDFR